MPTNRITISEAPLLVWEVGDSKMPEVVDLLNKVGFPIKGNSLSEGVEKAEAKAEAKAKAKASHISS